MPKQQKLTTRIKLHLFRVNSNVIIIVFAQDIVKLLPATPAYFSSRGLQHWKVVLLESQDEEKSQSPARLSVANLSQRIRHP